MSYAVDFQNVSTTGLETSPVAEALAGLRANEARYSEGMEVPQELAAFKFARQKSKLAGTIRGSFFVIKGEY